MLCAFLTILLVDLKINILNPVPIDQSPARWWSFDELERVWYWQSCTYFGWEIGDKCRMALSALILLVEHKKSVKRGVLHFKKLCGV